jgi:hypothetical protein
MSSKTSAIHYQLISQIFSITSPELFYNPVITFELRNVAAKYQDMKHETFSSKVAMLPLRTIQTRQQHCADQQEYIIVVWGVASNVAANG